MRVLVLDSCYGREVLVVPYFFTVELKLTTNLPLFSPFYLIYASVSGTMVPLLGQSNILGNDKEMIYQTAIKHLTILACLQGREG